MSEIEQATFMGIPLVSVPNLEESHPDNLILVRDPTGEEKRQIEEWAEQYVREHQPPRSER